MVDPHTTLFERRLELSASPAVLWDWHQRAPALERLVPPWEEARVEAPAAIEDGARATLTMKLGPLELKWLSRICGVEAGRVFVDVQERGPFASWRHEHRVEPAGAGSALVDRVHYRLPLEPLSWFARGLIRRRIERMFRYRHDTLEEDLRVHALHSQTALRVGVTGASGLVGGALVTFLGAGGHEVVKLKRRPSADEMRGLDAVVHLAGEPIFAARWTSAKKQRIRASRVEGTRALVEALEQISPGDRPKTLVCASAVGFYGSRGDEALDEEDEAGDGFLAEVVRDWEQQAQRADELGLRVTSLRLGIILSGGGGALTRMAAPFALGVGGPVGDPNAWMPWIALDDVLDVVLRALVDERVSGPVNAVRGAVTQREFAEVLGHVLHRPALMRVPKWALRLGLGREQADELLASARVEPARLDALEHDFRFDDLEAALRHCLGRVAA